MRKSLILWSRRLGLNRRPADYEKFIGSLKINDFHRLRWAESAKMCTFWNELRIKCEWGSMLVYTLLIGNQQAPCHVEPMQFVTPPEVAQNGDWFK